MENFVYFHQDFVGPQLGETEEVCIWELVLRFVSLHMNVRLVGKVWICIYLRIPVLISLCPSFNMTVTLFGSQKFSGGDTHKKKFILWKWNTKFEEYKEGQINIERDKQQGVL